MKRRLDRAISNEFKENSSHENINGAIKLAMNMKVIDILEPTGKTIGELAEIVSRLQNADSLEVIDIELFSSKLHSYS
jgi:hypothetical protein|tara:strand:- start:458 stop:691 length:234 start_codon:yes stop_codon:yes gene_type:complete